MRKQRLDLGILQKEVALKIGADSQTICNWENNITQPSIRWIPKIIDFLGYAPYSPPKSLGERLSNHRKHLVLQRHFISKTKNSFLEGLILLNPS